MPNPISIHSINIKTVLKSEDHQCNDKCTGETETASKALSLSMKLNNLGSFCSLAQTMPSP